MNLAEKEYLSSLEKEIIGDHVYFFSPSDKEYLSHFKDTIETLEELKKSKSWYQRIFDSKKLSEVKRAYKEEIDKIVKRISDLHKEQREEERLLNSKKTKMDKYWQLRKEIESMPQYGIWRQAVLQKFGRKCAVCGSTENLEVDHRYKSFYAITKEHGITNKVQAYGCAELWDVENGAPLCKTHHDQTPSSRKYLKNNQTTI